MLKSTKIRLFLLIAGIIELFGGCLFLVISCISICNEYYNNTITVAKIICILLIISYSAMLFYSSAQYFIKYGMCNGVDYELEQKSSNAQ